MPRGPRLLPDKSYAELALPTAVRHTFTYAVPPALRETIECGHRVRVRFGPRTLHGYVVGFLKRRPALPRIRPISRIEPPEVLFPPEILALTRWIADYYLASWGQVLEVAAPRTVRGGARVSAALIEEADGRDAPLDLLPAQRVATERVGVALERGGFAPFLLHGVTGSGKTEVYLDAAERVLRGGGSVLFMVPEIALGTQILSRIKRRFEGRVGLYHSQAGEANRRRVWREAREGRLPIVVGARSAVFVPLPNLRLIVVDEEHEAAYKQDETPRYHARDVAVWRARNAGVAVILGSATPSLESLRNTELGKYELLTLGERVDGRMPARAVLVDMAEQRREDRETAGEFGPEERLLRRIFSPLLRREIDERLDRGEQTILFLNRRGHATVVQCADCGETLGCERCDVILTWHKLDGSLRCHYCGATKGMVESCGTCHSRRFFYGGFGTQKVEEVLRGLWPEARIARMDQDTTRARGAHARLIDAMEKGEIDLLLGTQMIAKGLHFPRVTLVGVLQADREMHLPDFRASERAFQLLTQVGGRAGRGSEAGTVLFQTLMPEHYAVACAAVGDYRGFAARELSYREAFRYPPFHRMIHLLLDGPEEERVRRRAEALRDTLLTRLAEDRAAVRVLGPAPMPLSRLKGQYRWHLTLQGRHVEPLHRLAVLALDEKAPRGLSGVRVQADVDPIQMA